MNIENLPTMINDPNKALLGSFDGVSGGKLFEPDNHHDFEFINAQDAIDKLKTRTRVLVCAGYDAMLSIYTDDLAYYRAEFTSYGEVKDSIVTNNDKDLTCFINRHIDSINE